MPDLKSYKIISVKASEWDKEKSKPSEGEYVFTKKVFVEPSLYRTPHRPLFTFRWNRNHEYAIADWQNKWPGCTFVTPKDGYIVDRLHPNGEGHYVYKDAVLMKIPVEEYVEQRRLEIMRSEMAAGAAKKAWLQEAGALGVDLSVEEIKKAFGRN